MATKTELSVAFALGLDVDEVKAARYQPTRTPCPIFAIGDGYYAATATGSKPPPLTYGRAGAWECSGWNLIESPERNLYRRAVWCARTEAA